MANRFVFQADSSHKLTLWKKSMLYTAHHQGWITKKMVKDKIDRLSRCDDLTIDEKELLVALSKDIQRSM